jgi:hypothetical protein
MGWLERKLFLNPSYVLQAAGMEPDPWQRDLLESTSQTMILNCSRQTGKSQIVAALALVTAILEWPAMILFLAPTIRQSGNLFLHLMRLYYALDQPYKKRVVDSDHTLELQNGSKIVCLPDKQGHIRSFSAVRLLVIDEAAYVSDSLYGAVKPMLVVSGGRLVLLSSPGGKQGFFYDAWMGEPDNLPEEGEWCSQGQDWRRYCVPWTMCPRIKPELVERDRRELGENYVRQEYGCEFMDMIGAEFSRDEIEAAFVRGVGSIEFPED